MVEDLIILPKEIIHKLIHNTQFEMELFLDYIFGSCHHIHEIEFLVIDLG